MSLLLVLLVLLLPSLPVFAATYYVAIGGGGNTCSQGSPCGTIAVGLAKLTPGAGDKLYIRGGTYNEYIDGSQLANGTSESTRTLIAGYPGETVILQPTSAPGAVFDVNGWVVERQYVTLQNLILDAVNLNGGVFIGGPFTHYIRMQDCTVKNAHQQGISGYGDSVSGVSPHHLEFINMDVFNNGSGRLDHGFYICTQNMTIRDSRIHHNSGYNLQIYDTSTPNCNLNAAIYNNIIHDAQGDGEVTLNHGNNILFYNNVVYNSSIVDSGAGAPRLSVEVSYGNPNNTQIYNNTMDGAVQVRGTNVTGAIIKNNIYTAVNMLGGSSAINDHNLTYTGSLFVDLGGRDVYVAEGVAP